MKDAMMPEVKSVLGRSADFSKVSARPTRQTEAATRERLRIRTAMAIAIAASTGTASALIPIQDAQAMGAKAVASEILLPSASPQNAADRSLEAIWTQTAMAFPEALVAFNPVPANISLTQKLGNTSTQPKNNLSLHPPILPGTTQSLEALSQVESQPSPLFASRSKARELRANRIGTLAQSSTVLPTTSLEFASIGSNSVSLPAAVLNKKEQLNLPSYASATSEASPGAAFLTKSEVTASFRRAIATNSVQTIGEATQQKLPALVNYKTYQVQPGDTLEEIAHHHQVAPSKLAWENKLRNPNLIKIDQQLLIPTDEGSPSASVSPSFSRTVRSRSVTRSLASTTDAREKLKDDVMKLQQGYQQTQRPQLLAQSTANAVSTQKSAEGGSSRRLQRTHAIRPAKLRGNRHQSFPATTATAPESIENYYTRLGPLEGQLVEPKLPPLSSPEQYLPDSPTQFSGYIWPSKGTITSGYGRRWGKMHRGIDIAGPVGTPIVAAASGEVVAAGWSSGGYGNLVKVKHLDGSLTLYAHNSRILVRSGQKVQQGQLIAQMGSSGFSTGPHLHFEVRPNGGDAVNPVAYLPKQR